MAQQFSLIIQVKGCRYCFQSKCLVNDSDGLMEQFNLDTRFTSSDLFDQLKEGWFKSFSNNWEQSINPDEVGIYYYSEEYDYMSRLDTADENFYLNSCRYGYQVDQYPNMVVYICPIHIVDHYNNQKRTSELIGVSKSNQSGWHKSGETGFSIKIGVTSDQIQRAFGKVTIYKLYVTGSNNYGTVFSQIKQRFLTDYDIGVANGERLSLVINHGSGFYILDNSTRSMDQDVKYFKELNNLNRSYHLLVYVLDLDQIPWEYIGEKKYYLSTLNNNSIMNTEMLLNGGVLGFDSNWTYPSKVQFVNVGIAECKTCSRLEPACYKGLVYGESIMNVFIPIGIFSTYEFIYRHIIASIEDKIKNRVITEFAESLNDLSDVQLWFFDGNQYYGLNHDPNNEQSRFIYQDYSVWQYLNKGDINEIKIVFHLCPRNTIEPNTLTTIHEFQITETTLNRGIPVVSGTSKLDLGISRIKNKFMASYREFNVPTEVMAYSLPVVNGSPVSQLK